MKNIIVITGPTGVGKTKMSIELAKRIDAEIINADSMQVYKELNIGTAKVTEKEKENINKEYNASICEMEASGIYLTCLKNNVDCFFIKSVSDTVSGGKEEYEKFATLAADEALNILVNFIKNY